MGVRARIYARKTHCLRCPPLNPREWEYAPVHGSGTDSCVGHRGSVITQFRARVLIASSVGLQ